MKKRQIFFPVVGALLVMLLPTGCDRQLQFDLAEREFLRVTDLQSMLLDEVLRSYAGATSREIETLHDGYLHDGTFALLDSLDEQTGRVLERMERFCTNQTAGRLVEGVTLRLRLSRRLTDAEIPFVYRSFPPPWEYLEPDAAERMSERGDCRHSRRE